MSLNVGGIYVASSDRNRVVELVKAYWLERGASQTARDPLTFKPLGLEETGDLGFAVSYPRAGANAAALQWIAIYDSERYNGDGELAQFLAETLNVSVVIYCMGGASDIADIAGYGPPLANLPVCQYPNKTDLEAEDFDEDNMIYGGDWGEIETFIEETFPYAFLYYNELQKLPPDAYAAFQKEWAIFGFENIPHRPSANYSGPDLLTQIS